MIWRRLFDRSVMHQRSAFLVGSGAWCLGALCMVDTTSRSDLALCLYRCYTFHYHHPAHELYIHVGP